MQTLQAPSNGTPPLTNLMQQEQPIEEGGGGGGGGTPTNNGTNGTTGTTGTPCRVDMQGEYLTSMWMRDVSYYESWFLGDPEVCIKLKSPLAASNSGYTLETQHTMGRKTIEDTYRCNTRMYLWNKTTISNAIGYFWYEQDDTGDPITVTLNVGYKTQNGSGASAEVKFNIKNDDDQITAAPIDFDDCPSEGYYTGGTSGVREFRWTVENRP